MQNTKQITIGTSLKYIFVIAVVCQILIIAALLGASKSHCSEDEMFRVVSPDQRNDAVIIGKHCPLTATYATIYIVPHKANIEDYASAGVKEVDEIFEHEWHSEKEFYLSYISDDVRFKVIMEIPDNYDSKVN